MTKMWKRYETFAEFQKDFPVMAHAATVVAKPVDSPRLVAGDRYCEDRSRFIGTEHEMFDRDGNSIDQQAPVVTMKVLEVLPHLGIYWFWNETREINSIGLIHQIDQEDVHVH